MTFTTKIDLQKLFSDSRRIVIELGCGPNKKAGRIGIDRLDLPGVDIVANIDQGLPFLPDNSVDEIHSESFFEHVSDLEMLMSEIVRVLKPSGKNHMFVPHFSNPFYYSDYTHNKFFGLYTLYYFCSQDNQLRRKVPSFYTGIRIRVVSCKLTFYSSFAGLRFLKRCFQKVVNLNSWTQEFYEENLCYLIPCYGMELSFEADTQ